MRTWRENNLLREKHDMDEPKLVNYRDYLKEMTYLNNKYRNTIGFIDIYNMADYDDDPIELGIHWSAAIRTMGMEDTEEFISDLKQAVKDCKNFKYNGYIVDWSKD